MKDRILDFMTSGKGSDLVLLTPMVLIGIVGGVWLQISSPTESLWTVIDGYIFSMLIGFLAGGVVCAFAGTLGHVRRTHILQSQRIVNAAISDLPATHHYSENSPR